jgi:hypothetical protein
MAAIDVAGFTWLSVQAPGRPRHFEIGMADLPPLPAEEAFTSNRARTEAASSTDSDRAGAGFQGSVESVGVKQSCYSIRFQAEQQQELIRSLYGSLGTYSMQSRIIRILLVLNFIMLFHHLVWATIVHSQDGKQGPDDQEKPDGTCEQA